MTFEVKLLIAFVATHPLVILTKFGQNPIEHVEEETNCEKEEEEERGKKPQERNKLGETPNLKTNMNICLLIQLYFKLMVVMEKITTVILQITLKLASTNCTIN